MLTKLDRIGVGKKTATLRPMRKWVITAPGGFDALELHRADDPEPGPGEVRIRVAACGVNYADGIIRMGLYASAKQLHGYPITPGFEVAGLIDALGEGVVDLQLGQAVLALTLFGGYADCCVLPSHQVFACPDALSLPQAAAIPATFLTAWFMVHRQLHPRPGDRWLVHSAAGGVGAALVQLGRLAGCEVVAVVGHSDKRTYVDSMGAQAVIDKSSEALWPAAERCSPAGYQAVFDANGVSTLAQSYAHLAPSGTLAVYGFHSMLPRDGRVRWLRLAWDWWQTPRFNPLHMTQSNRSVVAANLSFLQSEASLLREGLQWILEQFRHGRLQPPHVTTFALEQADQAQRLLESGRSWGKLVLLT